MANGDNGLARAQQAYENQMPEENETICYCAHCTDNVFVGETVYEINDETIHEDCLKDWAKPFRKVAGE